MSQYLQSDLSIIDKRIDYIAEELKAKAIDLGIEGPHTSWWHMFGWNTFGVLLMGPAVATWRFFDTLNKIEQKLNHED